MSLLSFIVFYSTLLLIFSPPAVGSSNGALTHAYAAMGIPWLPQTFLIPVSRPHATGFTNGILDMVSTFQSSLIFLSFFSLPQHSLFCDLRLRPPSYRFIFLFNPPTRLIFSSIIISQQTKEMEWGREAARQFLDENPDLELHHMADPNQDKLMIEYMAYFRFKFRVLPQVCRACVRAVRAWVRWWELMYNTHIYFRHTKNS